MRDETPEHALHSCAIQSISGFPPKIPSTQMSKHANKQAAEQTMQPHTSCPYQWADGTE